jgi:uncharacterized lipoprotein YehR (DUF1307 family)
MYELEDILCQQIEGHFYEEELCTVRITKRTTYKKDKILKRASERQSRIFRRFERLYRRL